MKNKNYRLEVVYVRLSNGWYEVEGILRKGKDKDNNDTMYIEVINIKEIDSKKEEKLNHK